MRTRHLSSVTSPVAAAACVAVAVAARVVVAAAARVVVAVAARPAARFIAAGAVVAAALVVGCGSDTTTPSGGAGADKKLSDLTDAEKVDFCATNGQAFQAIATGSCTLVGLDAPTQPECASARDECTSMAATSGAVCDTAGSGPGDLSACTTVRVSVAESCIQQVQTFFMALTCDDAGKTTPTPPGCLGTIEAGCPALLGM